MSLWITPSGVNRLTRVIDESFSRPWTEEKGRVQDILGILESRGGGYESEQIVRMLAARPIAEPLHGTDRDYYRTIDKLIARGEIGDY